jgi:hypothetical protein
MPKANTNFKPAVFREAAGYTADDRVIPFPSAGPDMSHVGPDVPLNVRPEQIRLVRQHPSLILVNLLNALLVVVVLWPVFRRDVLLGWYASSYSSSQRGWPSRGSVGGGNGPRKRPHTWRSSAPP